MQNPIETRQLRVFLEVAEWSNMRKAGQNLHISTSAISHSLKNLESDLGCSLFHRNTRSITLTHAGKRFSVEAKDILSRLQNARTLINSWDFSEQSHISIGASSSACQYMLPQILCEFKQSFPRINIEIISGNSYTLQDYVRDKKVNIAIYPSEQSNNYKFESFLGQDELFFVTSQQHEWVKHGKPPTSQLGAYSYILSESGSYTYDLVRKYFHDQKVDISTITEITNEEVIKSLARLDIGIGILPDWIIHSDPEQKPLVKFPIGRKQIKRDWLIASPPKHELSFAESVFVGLVKHSIPLTLSKK